LPAIELTLSVRSFHVGHSQHLRLPAKPAFCSDLACDSRHLAGEGIELINHGVDGFLKLKKLATQLQ
jgi:hypothetical protein